MADKVVLADKEYSVDSLSEHAKKILGLFEYTSNRIDELENMKALLNRARNSYITALKEEVISEKGGFQFND